MSPSLSDVSTAVALAKAGDIVSIPAGTAHWTSTLTVTKPITLQGQTVITGPTSGPTVNRQTIIYYDVSSSVNQSALLLLNTTSGTVRVTGITFLRGTTTSVNSVAILTKEQVPMFRVDHCEFYNMPHYAFWVGGERGLIDHNIAKITSQFVEPHHGDFGDASFASPLDLGSDHAIFLEDNNVENLDPHVRPILDSAAGARYVIRNNYLINSHILTHGTESGGRNRAPRSWEIYNNTQVLQPVMGAQANAILFRGGTGVCWGNTVTGTGWGHFARLVNYRDTDFFSTWQGADGTSSFDLNDTSDYSGNGLGGGPGGICASGTHSGSNGATTLVVTGNPWKTNQWVKYTIKNVETGRFSVISSNTSNTISYLQSCGLTTPVTMPFNTGNHFQIRRTIQSLDHVGAGQSDLMGGGTAPTPRWLNQIIEPAYFFKNTFNGATVASAQVDTAFNLNENKDYYVQTVSFNGNSGIGVGPRASRPTTCAKGVGYWATDENKLYKATAANTWTLYYAPYTYPHPLTSLEPPSNLAIVAGP